MLGKSLVVKVKDLDSLITMVRIALSEDCLEGLNQFKAQFGRPSDSETVGIFMDSMRYFDSLYIQLGFFQILSFVNPSNETIQITLSPENFTLAQHIIDIDFEKLYAKILSKKELEQFGPQINKSFDVVQNAKASLAESFANAKDFDQKTILDMVKKPTQTTQTSKKNNDLLN